MCFSSSLWSLLCSLDNFVLSSSSVMIQWRNNSINHWFSRFDCIISRELSSNIICSPLSSLASSLSAQRDEKSIRKKFYQIYNVGHRQNEIDAHCGIHRRVMTEFDCDSVVINRLFGNIWFTIERFCVICFDKSDCKPGNYNTKTYRKWAASSERIDAFSCRAVGATKLSVHSSKSSLTHWPDWFWIR